MPVGFFGKEEGRGRIDDSALAGAKAGEWEEGSGNGGANALRLPVPIVFRIAGVGA
jgi:hypothetical protein